MIQLTPNGGPLCCTSDVKAARCPQIEAQLEQHAAVNRDSRVDARLAVRITRGEGMPSVSEVSSQRAHLYISQASHIVLGVVLSVLWRRPPQHGSGGLAGG